MANKSAFPLIAGAAALAYLMVGSSKKKKTTTDFRVPDKGKADSDEDEPNVFPPDRLVINQECTEILNNLEKAVHDQWLTNRAAELYNDGLKDLDALTLQLLKDQSEHCPWDDESKWTGLMKGLYEQLNKAVVGWAEVKAFG